MILKLKKKRKLQLKEKLKFPQKKFIGKILYIKIHLTIIQLYQKINLILMELENQSLF